MKSHWQRADWLRTAFVEAWGEVRSQTDFGVESIIGNLSACVVTDESRPFPPCTPETGSAVWLGSDNQKNIQYP